MKFDVICLSEIWKFHLEFYKNILPHYTAYTEPPADSNVGGVAVFVKSDFKITNRNDLKFTCSDTVKVEDLWYEITCRTNGQFLVGVIYRHPKGHVDKFTEILEGITTKIINDNKIQNCIIVGDLNIDLMKHETHYNTGEFLNTMLSHGFMPTILLPTRVTSHSCILIDHIFYYSKTFKNNFLTGNLFTHISDHFANFLLLDSNKKSCLKERPNVRICGDKNKENSDLS